MRKDVVQIELKYYMLTTFAGFIESFTGILIMICVLVFTIRFKTLQLHSLITSRLKSIKIIEFTEITNIELIFVALDRIISNQN